MFPDCAATKLNLAIVYEQRARFHETNGRFDLSEQNYNFAFDRYKEALKKDPQLPEIHYNLANFYLNQKNYDKAKAHFSKFLENSEDYSEDLQRNEGVKEVIAALKSQDTTETLFKEAFDAIKMGQEEKAISKITKYLDLHKDAWNAWFLYGWGCRRLGRYAEGKSAFKRALKLHKPHPDILNELAICLMELGELGGNYLCNVEDPRL